MRIMQKQLYRVRSLDLVLDHSRHEVTRGRRRPVDFGGNCRRWAVLTQLAESYPGFCSKDRLIDAVWASSKSDFDGIYDGTLYSTVWAVRRALRLLGVTVTYTKGLGYKLKETRRRG